MKTWTVFTAPKRAPVLVPEGFSWGALVFGPLWLAAGRFWLMALLSLVIYVAVAALAPHWALLVVAVVHGIFGQDIKRMALELRGFHLVHVVAATSGDRALSRLLEFQPQLLADAAR